MLNIVDKIKGNAERRVILPGSFNPLHEGHLRLLEIAGRCNFDLIHISSLNPLSDDSNAFFMLLPFKCILLEFYSLRNKIKPLNVFYITFSTACKNMVFWLYFSGHEEREIQIHRNLLHARRENLIHAREIQDYKLYFNYYRFKNWKHMIAQIVEVLNAHSRIKWRRDQLTTVIVRHYDNTFCCTNSINFTKQNKTVFLAYHEKYLFTVYCKIQSSFNIDQDVKKKITEH